jgi:hypothetical protein
MENDAGCAGSRQEGAVEFVFMLVGELCRAAGWMRYAVWLGYTLTLCDHEIPFAGPTRPLAAQRYIQIAAFNAPTAFIPYMV